MVGTDTSNRLLSYLIIGFSIHHTGAPESPRPLVYRSLYDVPCQLLTGNSIANRFVDTVMQRYNQVVGEACGKYYTFATNCD